MANWVETDEGKITENERDYDQELVNWLKQHNFESVIGILIQQNITLNTLISLAEDNDLKEYLNELNIEKATILLINSKIKQIIKNRDKSQIRHIILSEQENEAIENLKKHNKKISNALNRLSSQKIQIIKKEQQLKSEINAKFDKLITMISNKQEMIMKEITNQSQIIQSKITENSQILTQKQEITKNVLLSCNNLLTTNDMDKSQRKAQILSISNDVLNDEVGTYRSDSIECSFNDDNLSTVNIIYDNLSSVYHASDHI